MLSRFLKALWAAFCIVGSALNFSSSAELHVAGNNWWAIFNLAMSVLFLTWAVLGVIDLIVPSKHDDGK